MQKECRVEEGHLMPDHVHMMISDPTQICGAAGDRVHQGQEPNPVARVYGERKRNLWFRACDDLRFQLVDPNNEHSPWVEADQS
jgi:hypothetical protein